MKVEVSSFPQRAAPAETPARLMASFTLVVWVVCVIVGSVGLLVAEQSRVMPVKPPPPLVAKIIQVQITNDPTPAGADTLDMAAGAEPTSPDSPPTSDLPPALMDASTSLATPPLVAVAEPSPSIAFALPTTGPTRVVADPRQAVPVRSSTIAPTPSTAPAAPSAVRRIVYGQGEGAQPAPEYPREAVVARQQGVVVVRFTVNETGRVESAEAVTPSPFAILNQAAVRSIRENWRFAPGDVRSYEVSIEFQLKPRK